MEKSSVKKPAIKKVASKKPVVKKTVVKKTTTKKAAPKKKVVKASTEKAKVKAVTKEKSFFAGFLENVEQGAKLVKERTTELATETYEVVKKGATDAYDVSSQLVTELYGSASNYAEQFKERIEMKNLNAKRDKLTSELGNYFYKNYKIDGNAFSKFSKSKGFNALLKNIEKVDSEVVEVGKKLSESK